MSSSIGQEDPNKNQDPRVTWEGCSVLLDINDGDRLVFARLTTGSKLKIGNKNVLLRPLVGSPFGSLFQVDNGKGGPILSRSVPCSEGDNNKEHKINDEFKDNRSLVDNNTAQSLTGEDIDEMRREGATGREIVEALIANSTTFEKKTSFSQEKYRLKKQKKYAPKVLLRRPFARSICEAYFKKHPDRIGFLRMDTLSLLLSMANVKANSDVLVVDMVGGLVTGAVAERLGGTGYVCNTYSGATPSTIDIVRIFNFSDEICKRIVQSSMTDLCSCSSSNGAPGEHKDVSDIVNETNESDQPPSSDICSANTGETLVSSENEEREIREDTTSAKPWKVTRAGLRAPPETIKSCRENGFSSLIVAAPDMDPWGIVKEILPLLSYSAPFAVYHQHAQPLAVCMNHLQLQKMAIGLQISEPWLREYQVLPSRTHPHMQMSAFGGYILSGTRICSNDQP